MRWEIVDRGGLALNINGHIGFWIEDWLRDHVPGTKWFGVIGKPGRWDILEVNGSELERLRPILAAAMERIS